MINSIIEDIEDMFYKLKSNSDSDLTLNLVESFEDKILQKLKIQSELQKDIILILEHLIKDDCSKILECELDFDFYTKDCEKCEKKQLELILSKIKGCKK